MMRHRPSAGPATPGCDCGNAGQGWSRHPATCSWKANLGKIPAFSTRTLVTPRPPRPLVGQTVHFRHPESVTCLAALITFVYAEDDLPEDAEEVTGMPGMEWVDLMIFGRRSIGHRSLVCQDERTHLNNTWHTTLDH